MKTRDVRILREHYIAVRQASYDVISAADSSLAHLRKLCPHENLESTDWHDMHVRHSCPDCGGSWYTRQGEEFKRGELSDE